jgi:cytochrome c peroxidase
MNLSISATDRREYWTWLRASARAIETGKVSCASCHAIGSDALDDRRSQPGAVSLGIDVGTRNALGAINSSFYTWTNWGGRFDSQWSLPLGVAENAKLMNSTRLQIAHMLYTKYRTEYDAVFPVALDADLDPAATNASRFPATGKPSDANWTAMQAADQAIANRIYVNYIPRWCRSRWRRVRKQTSSRS